MINNPEPWLLVDTSPALAGQAAVANTVLEDLLRRESWSFEDQEASREGKI